MRVAIRRTADRATVAGLDRRCFPEDKACVLDDAGLWIAWAGGEPVGFAVASHPEPSLVFLRRAGVLPKARGLGLHGRLIAARVRWARQRGARWVITYTSRDNGPSMKGLLGAGFDVYEPAEAYVGPMVYFRRRV
jgi:GNAT superfamily N-acetyltransferase